MSKPIDLTPVHPIFHGTIQAIAPQGTEFEGNKEVTGKDASAKRLSGAEAAPRKRLVVESPDAGTPDYSERD